MPTGVYSRKQMSEETKKKKGYKIIRIWEHELNNMTSLPEQLLKNVSN